MNKEELEKLMADIEVAAIETARLRSILNKREVRRLMTLMMIDPLIRELDRLTMYAGVLGSAEVSEFISENMTALREYREQVLADGGDEIPGEPKGE